MSYNLSSDPVNPDNNFDGFVEGDCNRLALSMARKVVDNPGSSLITPLIICGNHGTGKSYLAQAIYNGIRCKNPRLKVLHMACVTFCSQYCEVLRTNETKRFYETFDQQECLIIDDVCYLVGKSKTQEVLSRFIIDHYLASGKQVVITSSIFPKDYGKFDPRFGSLLNMGTIGVLTNPSYETRILIIEKVIQKLGMPLGKNVIEHLALKVVKSIRELEGITVSIMASASILKVTVDINFVDETLSKLKHF